MTDTLRLATRGSKLALAQAEGVAAELRRAWPELDVDLAIVRTRGDVEVDRSVEAIGVGAFVKEVQSAVLDGRADAAVHAYKDLPTTPVPGLVLAAVPQRADPRDVLVSRGDRVFAYLPDGARIGTSSYRRGAMLRRRRHDLQILPIRGNVDTRLAKLDAGDYDAVVLAAAGLYRLGLLERVTEYFDTDLMIPAPAQGALAIEVRRSDARALALFAPLDDEATAYAVTAERSCLAALGGGCHTPIGVHAVTDGEDMYIQGIVLSQDGSEARRMRWSGPARKAEEVGSILAELLRASEQRIVGADTRI